MYVAVTEALTVLVPQFECQWLYSCKTNIGLIFLLFSGINSRILYKRAEPSSDHACQHDTKHWCTSGEIQFIPSPDVTIDLGQVSTVSSTPPMNMSTLALGPSVTIICNKVVFVYLYHFIVFLNITQQPCEVSQMKHTCLVANAKCKNTDGGSFSCDFNVHLYHQWDVQHLSAVTAEPIQLIHCLKTQWEQGDWVELFYFILRKQRSWI